jgi:SagB-type dehydrogenase family enzyme
VALATLVPMSPEFEPAPCQHAPGQPYVLSRFAYTRADRGETVLECPLSHARIILHDWRAVAAVHGLARPSRPADLSAAIPGLSCDTATALLGLLVAARMAGEPSGEGAALDEACPALRTWEFHDLLFHARSRAGRHDHPIGGTYRLAGQMPPPPVLKPPPSHGWTDLHRPDLERLEREDPPFARVQEARRSIRDFGTSPLSDRQLGEFLYRVGRVADYWEAPVATPRGPVAMAFAPRPYPAGGSLYELELYVTVRACQGLEAGLYHYDPGRHGLARLPAATADLDQLLADAGRAVGVPPERLQVLVVVAARFPRIAWKYASIAYSLLLKHVGVLYQTMYLVATAMNLAPCAVGCGNADLFARAAGTDYYAETSVGEFLLGSRP